MKPITAIVPDFRDALDEALKDTAEKVVRELQVDGPYWTGLFQSLWVIEPGRKAIPARVVNPLEVPKDPPRTRRYETHLAPESPNLGGYTIGNQAKYRLSAMDIVPALPRDAPNARITAERFWFDTYINAKMPETIRRELSNVFRRYK